ncbi:MAG: hypothetical protein ABII08_04715, partial [Candidatus Beckwithbacteria bacterium]
QSEVEGFTTSNAEWTKVIYLSPGDEIAVVESAVNTPGVGTSFTPGVESVKQAQWFTTSEVEWTKVIYLKQGQEIAVANQELLSGSTSNQKTNDPHQTKSNNNQPWITLNQHLSSLSPYKQEIHNKSKNTTSDSGQPKSIGKIQFNHDLTSLTKNKAKLRNTYEKVNPATKNNNFSDVEILAKNGATTPPVNQATAIVLKNSDKTLNWPKDNFSINQSIIHQSNDVKFVKILSIEYVGEEQVWDIEVENTHNFVGNGIIAHNTYISGNLGIGTTSPDYKLDVNGDIRIASGSDLYIGTYGLNDNASSNSGASLVGLYDDAMTYIASNTTVQGAVKELDTAIGSLSGTSGWYLSGDTGTPEFLGVGNTAVFTGGIGIDTAVSATDTLSLTFDSTELSDLTWGSGSPFTWTLDSGATDPYLYSTSNVLSLMNGNVGIGTTNPLQELHVEGQCVTGDTLLPILVEEKTQNIPGSDPVNQKTAQGADLVSSANLPKDESDKLNSNISQKYGLSSQNMNVDSPGVEPDERGLSDPSSEPAEPTSTKSIAYTRIDQIKGGELVYSLNEETGKLEPQPIKGLLDMGVQPVYKLTTEDGKTITTTGNHPYLARRSSTIFFNNQNNQTHGNSQQQQESTGTGNNLFKTHNYSPFLSRITPNTNSVKPAINNNIKPDNDILVSNPKAPGSNKAPKEPITAAWETSRANEAKNLNWSSEKYNSITNNHSTDWFTQSEVEGFTTSNAEWTKVIYLSPGDEIAVVESAVNTPGVGTS